MTASHGEALIEVARQWVRATHPSQALHMERTLDFIVDIDPAAALTTRLAGLMHDIERAFPGSPVFEPDRGWDDPLYNVAHMERCGRFVGDFLRDQGVEETFVRTVVAIVVVHERGGWPEADLVQAADSLSFLDVNVPLAARWAASGRTTEAQARAKLQYSFDRMKVERARELGRPLLERAWQIFEAELADARA